MHVQFPLRCYQYWMTSDYSFFEQETVESEFLEEGQHYVGGSQSEDGVRKGGKGVTIETGNGAILINGGPNIVALVYGVEGLQSLFLQWCL